MNRSIDRAFQIARDIQSDRTWVDSEEIAQLLEFLATCLKAQHENFSSVEFALQYYSEPHLYHDPETDVLLDGGLRARTALGLLKKLNAGECVELP